MAHKKAPDLRKRKSGAFLISWIPSYIPSNASSVTLRGDCGTPPVGGSAAVLAHHHGLI